MVTDKKEKLLSDIGLEDGNFEIPIIYHQKIDLYNIEILGFHNTKYVDKDTGNKTVHFFIPDRKFDYIINNPERQVKKLLQYRQVCLPDFSVFPEMSILQQKMQIAKMYYCGACWQKHGIVVIPTATWSDKRSYDFCFNGIEKGAVVAVSTLGTKKYFKELFLAGFKELCKRKHPSHIICYCKPFDEMYSIAQSFNFDIIYVPDESNTKRKKSRQKLFPGQLEFNLWENEKQIS
ncbi:hypothetical protein FACS189483_01260 [Spirochaetia bacterium]|nr:hypothetical protein FACS189483_01260 [Spirochaetia bacterium]